MRIAQLPIWLTVTWSAGLGMVAGQGIVAGQGRSLTWTADDFLGERGVAIIEVNTLAAPKSFRFTLLSPSVHVNSVNLVVNGTPVASATPTSPSPTGAANRDGMVSSSVGGGTSSAAGSDLISITQTPSQGYVTIQKPDTILASYNGSRMTFEVIILVSGAQWLSTSRSFTFVSSGLNNSVNVTIYQNDDSKEDSYTPPTPAVPTGSTLQTTSTSKSTATPGLASDSAPNAGSALGPGPIAGIVVGVVGGLLLIGALVWWLIRRQPSRTSTVSDKAGASDFSGAMAYGGPNRNRTQELMAEKEANVGLDPGPHSPYSDDGGPTSSSNGPVAVAGGAAGIVARPQQQHHQQHQYQQPTPTQAYHTDPQSFVPYSDHPASSPVPTSASVAAPVPLRSPSTRISQHSTSHAAIADDTGRSSVVAMESSSPTGGRETPLIGTANAPTPYVHLVEEGMTEDDIRRLEEEERELDQAIERAGRGGGASTS